MGRSFEARLVERRDLIGAINLCTHPWWNDGWYDHVGVTEEGL